MSKALLTVKVSDDNGTEFDLDLTSRSILRWEKAFPGRSYSQLETKFAFVYEAVYVAAKSRLPEGTTFDQFCERYDVSPQEDQPPAQDPTRSTA